MTTVPRPEPDCAGRLRVLADGTRLAVVRELLTAARTVGELEARVGVYQSLLSHHLRVLRDAGLVTARREGRAVRYGLAPGVGRRGRALDLGCCALAFEAAGTRARGARAPGSQAGGAGGASDA